MAVQATEIEGLKSELAEAKQRADMSSALFHRSVDADTAELQVLLKNFMHRYVS